MRTTLYKYIACCLWGLLLGSTPALAAQDGDDYAPEFPEEPMEDPEKEQEEVDNGQNGILGDVNRDGMINTQDAVMLTKLYLAGDPDGQLVPSICDMNGDGVVNTADAVAIVNYYLTHVQ